MRERGGERAAARLVARVAQRDARQGRLRLDGNDSPTSVTPASSAADSVTILNTDPGGCGRDGQPGERQHVPAARRDDGDAADAVAQRGGRGGLERPGRIVVFTDFPRFTPTFAISRLP